LSVPPPDSAGPDTALDDVQKIRRADPAWLTQVLGIRVEGFEEEVIGGLIEQQPSQHAASETPVEAAGLAGVALAADELFRK
jgi:hypothetical protein